jgi:hypothetical protein
MRVKCVAILYVFEILVVNKIQSIDESASRKSRACEKKSKRILCNFHMTAYLIVSNERPRVFMRTIDQR